LLGFEVALYVILYAKSKLKSAALNILTPFAVGFIDEGIQIFSGRGPAITDVLIDASGFITLSIVTYIFGILIRALCSKKQRRKNG
jgi:VanZ family protein